MLALYVPIFVSINVVVVTTIYLFQCCFSDMKEERYAVNTIWNFFLKILQFGIMSEQTCILVMPQWIYMWHAFIDNWSIAFTIYSSVDMIGLVEKGQLFLEQFIYLHIIYFMSNYKSRCISIKSTFLELWTAILYYVFEKMDSLICKLKGKIT